MYLGQFLLSENKKVLDIRNDVQKLFITYTWTGPKIADLEFSRSKQVRQMAFYSGLGLTGKLTATRYTPNGTKQVIQGMSLYDLCEIAANNDGIVDIQAKNTDVNNVEYTTRFSVELCNTGSIKCTDNDFIRLEFTEFKKYTIAATDFDGKIEISSFGGFQSVNQHLKYSPLACQAGAVVQFSCEGHYAIAVPSTCTKLTLNNATGVTQELNADELYHISVDMEDSVYCFEGVTIPFHRWRVLPIQFAYSGTVQLSETASVYLLSNKEYNTVEKAA